VSAGRLLGPDAGVFHSCVPSVRFGLCTVLPVLRERAGGVYRGSMRVVLWDCRAGDPAPAPGPYLPGLGTHCAGIGLARPAAAALAAAPTVCRLGELPRLLFLRVGRSSRLLGLHIRKREMGTGGSPTVGPKRTQAARRDPDSLRCRSLRKSGGRSPSPLPPERRLSTIDKPERD